MDATVLVGCGGSGASFFSMANMDKGSNESIVFTIDLATELRPFILLLDSELILNS